MHWVMMDLYGMVTILIPTRLNCRTQGQLNTFHVVIDSTLVHDYYLIRRPTKLSRIEVEQLKGIE